jgi:hypothetical protein
MQHPLGLKTCCGKPKVTDDKSALRQGGFYNDVQKRDRRKLKKQIFCRVPLIFKGNASAFLATTFANAWSRTPQIHSSTRH